MGIITDSDYQPNEVIIQNPDNPCPEELLRGMGLMKVKYLGFDKKIHFGQMVISTKVMSEVEAFFRQAFETGFSIEKVIPVSAPEYRWNGKKIISDNVSAGFDYRKVETKNKLSLHSQGLAFDINPRQNPYVRYKNKKPILSVPHKDAIWDPQKSGVLYAEHPLVKLMEGFGWEWGGHWTPESGRTDYMHFQKPINKL